MRESGKVPPNHIDDRWASECEDEQVREYLKLALTGDIDETRLRSQLPLPCSSTEQEVQAARDALKSFAAGLRRLVPSVLL